MQDCTIKYKMKTFASVLMLAVAGSAQQVFESANEMQVETGLDAEPLSYSVRKSSSGALVEESNWGSHVTKKVIFPNAPFYDHSLSTDRIEHMTEGIREAKKKMQQ
jgi:hypothetical protein